MAQARGRRSLRDLLAWIADNLGTKFFVSILARRAAMSPRNYFVERRDGRFELPASCFHPQGLDMPSRGFADFLPEYAGKNSLGSRR
jgi:hypothetical protein